MKIVRVLLPVLVLALGVGAFRYLVKSKPEAEKKAAAELGVLVEAQRVARSEHAVVVHAHGTVTPAEQVVLQPEVGGRILWRNDELVPGGIVRAGTPLVRIDPKNYQLALQQQEAQVNRAELELTVEQSRKTIAEREWQLLQQQRAEGEANPLALRDPQLKTARVSVDAAKSALETAKLAVSRTAIAAPFNAFVQRAMADRGQIVSPSSQLATLVGIDRFWVQISVPLENLAWIRVPGLNGAEGSIARVSQEVGDQHIERVGRVVRLLGDLDPVGRMARVLVEIDDPFGLRTEGERGLPMLVGAFVEVEIDGGKLRDVVEVPRTALRDGERAFVLSSDQKLVVRPVRIVWRTPEHVLVREGLTDGDMLITSRVSSPIEGMTLRLAKPASQDTPAVVEKQ